MEMLIVTFRLTGLADEAYRADVEAMAPIFLDVPGLLGKTWLADPASQTYGGVYAFADRQSTEAYLASDIVKSMRANPHLDDMQTRAFGTIEDATRITHGLLPITAQLSPPLLSESVSAGRHW
jgi:hypothetical protein